jgi:hypothetical protein
VATRPPIPIVHKPLNGAQEMLNRAAGHDHPALTASAFPDDSLKTRNGFMMTALLG